MGTHSLVLTLLIVCVFVIPTYSVSRGSLFHDHRSIQMGLRATLRHVDSGKNLTKLELIRRAIDRGNRRAESLKAIVTGSPSIESLVSAGNGEYLMELAIGTPQVPFIAVMDTGSDLIWTQCQPCISCFKQSTPIFDPRKSSTYKNLSCSSQQCNELPGHYCMNACVYEYVYADFAVSTGFLATDTLSFMNGTSASNIAFGCGLNNGGQGFQGSGLVGLGRGALSLVSQLNEPKFSYCLSPPSSSEISLLLLSSSANKPLAGPFKTTPLVRNPVETSIYYVNLLGISIGGAPLDIPPGTFTTSPNGSGGTIIDSGTTMLILNTTAYSLVNSTLSSLIKLEQVSLPPVTGVGPCWKTPTSNYTFPSFILHLDGADWELPSKNYLIEEPSSGATCLAVAPSYEYSIIGNIAQHNTLIVYDLVKETLSFAPADCSGI